MLVSYSIPKMRPMIEAGLAERAGEALPEGCRVKRQTIRARGPQWLRVLAASEGGSAKGGKVDRDLHHWWKSRTKERALLGVVRGFEIYPVAISRGRGGEGGRYITVSFPDRYIMGLPTKLRIAWAPELFDFACKDGFESAASFAEFFVPEPGDRFPGVLIKW